MIRRGGFTLMEMILALAIGVMLLGALYLTINTQMEVNEQGREVVEQSALVRALFQRITQDAQTCLQAVDPRILPDTAVVSSSSSSTGTSGTSGTSSGASSGTTSGSSTSGTSSSSSSTSSDSSSSSSTTPMDAITIYNLGIEGDSSRLTISAARVPRELLARDKIRISTAQLPTVSDLRRITYWLIPAGDGGVGGLARQELTGVTSLDADDLPPNVGNAGSYIIAPEVTNLAFEYKGASDAPEGSWSSTEQDIETGLLRGPPAAIIVHLSIRAKDGTEKAYRHVIALPTGNNYPPQ